MITHAMETLLEELKKTPWTNMIDWQKVNVWGGQLFIYDHASPQQDIEAILIYPFVHCDKHPDMPFVFHDNKLRLVDVPVTIEAALQIIHACLLAREMCRKSL